MEALAAIGLVRNIVQFVDFSGKLISKSIQLHHSYDGALIENVDTENAAKHLMVLTDLLFALNKIKMKDRQQKSESIRKALRSVWSQDDIRKLEQRLVKLKEELTFHIIVRLR